MLFHFLLISYPAVFWRSPADAALFAARQREAEAAPVARGKALLDVARRVRQHRPVLPLLLPLPLLRLQLLLLGILLRVGALLLRRRHHCTAARHRDARSVGSGGTLN